MTLSFHGAARKVTGSCSLLEANGHRVLIDCGINGFSAHADQHETLAWRRAVSGAGTSFLVHGEMQAMAKLAALLPAEQVEIPCCSNNIRCDTLRAADVSSWRIRRTNRIQIRNTANGV
jgi:Cft2 family RNA processing exonuclease